MAMATHTFVDYERLEISRFQLCIIQAQMVFVPHYALARLFVELNREKNETK